jgi:hypothetical protein
MGVERPSNTAGFAASVNDFVGGGEGLSGVSPLDHRLQGLSMPLKLTTASAMPAIPGAHHPGSSQSGQPRPIWQSLAFIDLFADAAGGARAALLAKEELPAGLLELSTSMKLMLRLLRTLSRETATAAAADPTFVSAHAQAGPYANSRTHTLRRHGRLATLTRFSPSRHPRPPGPAALLPRRSHAATLPRRRIATRHAPRATPRPIAPAPP